MNHVYRLKQSGSMQELQPVPETARSAGKGQASTSKSLAQIVTTSLASVALGGMASLSFAQQAPPAVNQLPQGGVVTRGSANINTSSSPAGNALMTVNQNSTRAVIDWASFNVGSNAKVQFNQPSSSAVVLNQILGNNASQIYGQISANGQVYLSNPNGVYFSPTAQVNVGGLVATTGKANADEFMAGKASFNRNGATGSVVNEGQLNVTAGGYIALLAPEVRNQGVIVAQAGTVALATGEAITLNFNTNATGLAGITTTPQAIAALVENRTAVLAEGGQIILSAHALASLQGAVVKNSGQLNATSLQDKGGKIVLMGDSIALTKTSKIEASGATGGGTVLVGGDWQGSGDMRQATQVTMALGASIEANATQQGDGGKVVLWSDVNNANSLTQVEGRIDAKGAGLGKGGQVETSGHALQVGAQTQVNTGGGDWLLDPSDITISSGTTSGIALSSSTYTPSSGAATSVVNATTLVGNLATNSINITTTNSGTSGAGTGNINVAADLSWSSNKVLTLTAAGGISGSGNIDMTGAAGTGVVFKQEGNSTYAGSISGSNATFTKQGAGNLTLTGTSNTYAGLTTMSAGTLTAGVANAFGTGNITVSGGTLNLGDFSQTSGVVSIPNSGLGGTITSTSNGLLVGSTFNFTNASRTTTISANLAGSGRITNTGSTLILTGNLANTGGITVNGGTTIQIGDGVNSGSFDVTGNFVVGGTLAFNRPTNTTVPTNSLSASGTIANLFYGTVLDLSATTHTGTMIFSPSVNMTAATPTVASIRLPNSLTEKTLDVLTTGFQSSFTPLPVITWAGTPTGSPTLKLNGVTVTSGADAVGGKLTKNSGDLSIGPGALWSFTTAGSTRYYTVTSDATDTTLSGTSSINVAQGVSATQSGAISDTVGAVVGLTVRGGGTLTLSGNNSNFSGLTTVSAGTLKAGSSTAFGTGAISVTSGASLDLNGQAITGAGNLTLNGTGVNNSGALMNSGAAATYSGPVLLGSSSRIVGGTGTIALTNTSQILGAGRNLTLGGAAGGSFAATISTSAGTVTKEDGGTWVLSGSNTYTGGTNVNAGTLQTENSSALSSGPVAVAAGATLAYNVAATMSPTNTFSGAGTIANVAYGRTLDLSGATLGGFSGTYAAAVNESVSPNTVASVVLPASPNLGSNTLGVNTVGLDGGFTDTPVITWTGTASGTPNFKLNGTTVSANQVVNSRSLGFNANNLTLLGAPPLWTMTINGVVSNFLTTTDNLGANFSGVTIINIPAGVSVTESGVLSGVGNVTITGGGSILLTGNNSYSGITSITNATVKLGHGSALGIGTSGVTVASGSVLDLNGQSVTANKTLTLNGSGVSNSGALKNSNATAASWAGLVTLGSATRIVGDTGTIALNSTSSTGITGSYALTLGGASGGTIATKLALGTGSLVKQDSGTWTLSGASVFTGGVTVSGGTLAAGVSYDHSSQSGAFGGVGNAITVNGGTLALGAYSQEVPAVTVGTDGGSITSSTGVLYASSITFNNTAAASASAILYSNGLTKNGSGVTTLSGNNIYYGGTFINAGTLQISSDANLGAVPNSPATNITINGGTLQISNPTALVTLNANRSISVGSSGATFNSTDTFYSTAVNGTISGSGPVTFTSAKDLTVSNIALTNNSPILLKAAGDVVQASTKAVSTVGGTITYWADSDGDNSGSIQVVSGTSSASTTINSGGADIVMGGGNGASAAAGYARGINVGAYTRVQAGAGNVRLLGMASSNGIYGVNISGTVSGADVSMTGRGYDNATGTTIGLSLTGATITASNQANITGVGGATLSTATSVFSNKGLYMSTSIIEGTGSGHVTVTANGGGYLPGAENTGLEMIGGSTDNAIRSVNGTVIVNATAGPTSPTSSSFALKTRLSAAAQPGNVIFGGSSQVGAITVNADNMSFDSSVSGKFTKVQSGGPVTLTSQSASFSGGGVDLSYVSFSNTLSSLTVGQVGNTSTIYLGIPGGSASSGVSNYSIAGPININGYADINRPLISTGIGSNGRITLGGSVIERTGGSVTGAELLLAGTGSSLVQMLMPGNSIGTLAGSGLGRFMLGTSSALTVGTLGSTQGLTSNNTIELYTSQGDLTLSNNIVTTSTASDAITLTAGKNAAVGDITSGNLVLNGGTVSVGAGGRTKLYTGAVTNSALTTLVGSGSGRFRYGSTQTVSNFTNQIVTGGIYAIYRERPTVSWSSSSDQTIVYGATPVPPVDGTQAGFANGDQADPTVTLRIASTNTLAAPNRNGGYYDAGSYVYSRTTLAQTLGYLASNPRLTITGASLNVTANDFTKSYNGKSYTGGNGVVYTGFQPGDSVANSLRGTLSYSGTAQSAVNAGSYSIVPTGLTSSNYSLNFVNGTLTVNKVPLKVTINDAARFVVEADTPGYKGALYEGWVNKENSSVLGGSLSIARTGGDTAAGIYKGVLQGSGLTSNNYNISYVSGNFTIVPADQLLVELTNTSSTYAGTTTYGLTSARYYRSSTRSIVDLTSNAVLSGNSLTLNDGAGGNTAFTVGTLSPVLSSSGKLSVGAYQMGATSIANSSANYNNTITVTGGLQINPKDVSASVTSKVSKPYDGTTAMNGLTIGVNGTVAGDVVTAAGNAAYAAKDAGTGLTYNVNNITLSGADARNYVLTDSVTNIGSNTLTGNNGVITPVVLNIKADNASKSYDGIAWSGGNGVTYSGFVGNEDANVLGGSLIYAGTSQGASNAGTYSIIPSGLTSTNYTIGYTNGSLIINPAGLMTITGTVVAPSGAAISKVYDGNSTATLGTANYSIVGWAAGEGATVTKTTGTYNSPDAGTGKTVTVSLLPTDYVATGTTNLSNYYLPTSVSGAVGVITPKTVTVTNTARSTTYDALTTYGSLASGTSFTTSAMVGSDSVGSVSQSAYGVSASGVAQAGNFAVRASNAVMGVGNSANYDFAYVDASYTVAKANLAVTASSVTSPPSTSGNIYNGSAYTGTYTTNALGNDASAITVTGMATGINAGTYTSNLVVSGAVLANYNTPIITNADLVITPKTIAATSINGALQGSVQKVYDGTNIATLTASNFWLTGWVSGEGAWVTKTSGIYDSVNAGNGKTVTVTLSSGDYAPTGSTRLINYTLPTTLSGAVGQISKAPLTVTGNSAQLTYNGAYQSVSGFTISGLQGTDTVSNLRGISATGVVAKNAGRYTNSVTAGTETNYTVNTIDGTLVIDKAVVTPNLVASNKVYDATVTAQGAITLAGVFSSDSAAASPVATGYKFGDVNVGPDKTVTASGISLNSALSENYTLSANTATALANITPAPLKLVANNDAKFVTQTDSAAFAGYSIIGLIGNDTSASSGIASGVNIVRSNSAVNLAAVYPDVLVPSGNATIGNYAISYVPGTFTIVPAGQLLVRTTSTNTSYGTAGSNPITSVSYLDANSNAINNLSLGSQTGAGEATVYTYNDGVSGTASFALTPAGTSNSAGGRTNVGSYGLISDRFFKTTNNLIANTAAVTGNLTVQPLAINVAANQASTTYNGSYQQQTITSGVLNGDAVVVSGMVNQRNAGSYTSALSASGADKSNYNFTFSNSNYFINQANLSVAYAADKVYDGSTAANLTSTDNRISGDVFTVSAVGRFADKNVGTAKQVNVSSVTLAGADAANYSVSSSATATANITRLPQVTWVGGASGSWFDPANWAGGAVPDLANVANVSIPQGVTVNFDNLPTGATQAGAVVLDSLGTAGNLTVSAGALNVGTGGVTLNALSQTGGSLTTSGAVTVSSLNQAAGSLSAGSLSTIAPFVHTGLGTVTVAGRVVAVEGSGVDNLPRLPFVLIPEAHHIASAYELTVLKLPQGNEAGAVHIELRDRLADAEISLPVALQNWVTAAGSALSLVGTVEGIELTSNGSAIRLSDIANHRFPMELTLQSGEQRVSFRIVKRP
jgi:filamentous hemagglutinin family protein